MKFIELFSYTLYIQCVCVCLCMVRTGVSERILLKSTRDFFSLLFILRSRSSCYNSIYGGELYEFASLTHIYWHVNHKHTEYIRIFIMRSSATNIISLDEFFSLSFSLSRLLLRAVRRKFVFFLLLLWLLLLLVQCMDDSVRESRTSDTRMNYKNQN